MLLLGVGALTSCNDDLAQPPLLTDAEQGNATPGTWNNPYTVTQVLEGTGGTSRWFTGYIVGWIDTNGGNNNVCDASTCTFKTPATLASNILMAATPDETNWTKCIPVQLPVGDVRAALNLMDNPTNLGKQVCVYGDVATYFSISTALKNLTYFNWGAEGIESAGQESDALFSAPFTDLSYSGFHLEGIVPQLANGTDLYLWTLSSSYGLVANAYSGGTRFATDTWGVSPVLDLKGCTAANVSFDWAGNYFSNQQNFMNCVQIGAREKGQTEWQILSVPSYPDGKSWTFVNSGNIDLAQWLDKEIEIGINYKSTTTLAGTFELKNFVVNAEGGTVQIPGVTEPIAPGDTGHDRDNGKWPHELPNFQQN